MTSLVLDTSMAAAWLLDDEIEPSESAAIIQLRSEGATVPQIFHFEIRNALLVAERRGRISREETGERISTISEIPIETDADPDLNQAFELARSHRLSFYDALYLELAIRLGSGLATLDRALASAAEQEGIVTVE